MWLSSAWSQDVLDWVLPGLPKRIHVQVVYLEGDPRQVGEWGSETEKKKANTGCINEWITAVGN